VESRIEKRAAGATQPSQERIEGKLGEFGFWMPKQGYKESSAIQRMKRLKTLIKRGANLLDPESVKEVIAKQSGLRKLKP